MGQINVFDVEFAFNAISANSKNGWYTQTIIGAAPEPRVDFCVGVVSAPDESSFNIHVWNPTTNKYYDEVWVLSIPSFQWIQVFKGTANRIGHTCHIVGNRQMITVGGIASSNTTATCDWESMGVEILDLTLMRWGSIFDSKAAPYQVNTLVSDVIGGGPDGNATKLLPEGGWTSTGLANLFTGTNNQTEPYSPSGSPAARTGPNNTRAATIGAIVGGVVAGVVSLAVIGVLVWGIKTKRFRRLGRTELQSTPETSSARPAAVDASAITPEVSGTPMAELSGRPPTPELEGR